MAEKVMNDKMGALSRGRESGSNFRVAQDPRYQSDMQRREGEAMTSIGGHADASIARDKIKQQRDESIAQARAAKEQKRMQQESSSRQQQPSDPAKGPATRDINKGKKSDPMSLIKQVIEELSKRFKNFMNKALKPAQKFFDLLGKSVTQLKDHILALTKTLQAQLGAKQVELTADQQLLMADQNHLLVTEANTLSIAEETQATKQLTDTKTKETSAGMGAMGMFFALQTVLSMFSSNLEETDGFFKGMAKSAMKFAMTLVTAGFLAMQMGVKMSAAGIGDLFRKTGLSLAIFSNKLAFGGNAVSAFGLTLNRWGKNIAAANGMMMGAGLAMAAAFYLVAGAFQRQAQIAKKAAIESGNVQVAGAQAVNEANWGMVKVIGAAATALAVLGVAAHGGALAVWSFALPVIAAVAVVVLLLKALGALDPVLNALRNTLAVFGIMDSTQSIKLKAEAEAQATKTTEALSKGMEELDKVSKDVSDGLTTAAAALQSDLLGNALRQAAANIEIAGEVGAEGAKGFWRGLGEWALEIVTLGLADTNVSSAEVAGRRAVMDQMLATNTPLNTQQKRTLGESVGIEEEELSAYKKARGELVKAINAEATLRAKSARESIVLGNEFSSHLGHVNQQIQRYIDSGAWDKLGMMEQREIIHEMNVEYHNAAKAMVENVKRLQAFNFGLGETEGVVALAHANLNNLSDAFNTGTVEVQGSIRKLSAVIESGASMDPSEFRESLDKINSELKDFGVDPRTATNLTNQFEALNAATGLFRDSAMDFVDDPAMRNAALTPEKFNTEIKAKLSEDMQKQRGISKTEADRLMDMLPELSAEDASEIMSSNLGVLEDKFGEINDKLKRQLELVGQIAALTEVATKENARRLEVEQAVFAAQRKSVDIQLEAAKIAAKHGGKAVDSETLRKSAIRKANVGIGRSGLNALSSGSVAEIQQRNAMIKFGTGAVAARGKARVAGGEKFFGAGGRIDGAGKFTSEGQATEAQDKALRQAQQEQLRTIKDLIAAEEKHLKTIEEKNRLERESLNSLIDGDVEEFLKKQAAVGATAAIATGDSRLAGLFGAEAMAGAFKNLKTQQQAGVSHLFGQKIGGTGGLLETAAGASLAQRGVTDPRMARLMAMTTGAEEGSRNRIRGLAGTLGGAGELGADIAKLDLKTAEFRVGQAVIQIGKARGEATAKTAQMEDRRARQAVRTNEIRATAEAGVTSSKGAMDAYKLQNKQYKEQRLLTDAALHDNTIYVRDTHAHGLTENQTKAIMQMDTGQTEYMNSLSIGSGQGMDSRPQAKIVALLSQGLPLMKSLKTPLLQMAKNTSEMRKVATAMKTAWSRGGAQGMGLGSRLARVGRAGRGAFGQTAFGRGVAGANAAVRGGISNFRSGYGMARGGYGQMSTMFGGRMSRLGGGVGRGVNAMADAGRWAGGKMAGAGRWAGGQMAGAGRWAGVQMARPFKWAGGAAMDLGRGLRSGAGSGAYGLAGRMPGQGGLGLTSQRAMNMGRRIARPVGAARAAGRWAGGHMANAGRRVAGAARQAGGQVAGAGRWASNTGFGKSVGNLTRGIRQGAGFGYEGMAGRTGPRNLGGGRGSYFRLRQQMMNTQRYGSRTGRAIGRPVAAARTAGRWAGGQVAGAGRWMGGQAAGAGRWAGGQAAGAGRWMGGQAAGAGRWAGGQAAGAGRWMGGQAAGAGRWMGGQAAGAGRWMGGQAAGAGRWMGGQVAGAGRWAGGKMAGAGRRVGGLAGRARSAMGGIGGGVRSGIRAFGTQFSGAMNNTKGWKMSQTLQEAGIGTGGGRMGRLGSRVGGGVRAMRGGISNFRAGYGITRGTMPMTAAAAQGGSRMGNLGARFGGVVNRVGKMGGGLVRGAGNIIGGARAGFQTARGGGLSGSVLKAMSSTKGARAGAKIGTFAGKVTGVSKMAKALSNSKFATKLMKSSSLMGKTARGVRGVAGGIGNLGRGLMTGMAGAQEMNLGMNLGRGGRVAGSGMKATKAMMSAGKGGAAFGKGGLGALKATKMGSMGMKAGMVGGRIMPWLMPLLGAAVGGMEAGGITKTNGKQMGTGEGMLLGALTGSATAGDSMLSGVGRFFGADIEKGGKTDRSLGVLGAAGMGAMTGAGIGGMVGGPVGAAIGAGVGAIVGAGAELYKNMTQESLPEIKNDTADLEQAGGDYMESLPTGVSMLPVSRQAAASRREQAREGVPNAGSMSQEEMVAYQQRANQQMATPGLAGPMGAPAGAGGGGLTQATDPEFLTQVVSSFGANIALLATSLDQFNQQLSSNISELKNLKFQVKLETTNVNINFNGTSFLQQLSASIKDELLREVSSQLIPALQHDGNGGHKLGTGTLPT
jgi:hypothetical protein